MLRETAFIAGAAVFLFLLAALVSYSAADSSFANTSDSDPVNWGGIWGAYVSSLLFELFGYSAYLLCLIFLLFWRMLLFHPFVAGGEGINWWWICVGIVLFTSSSSSLEYLRFHYGGDLPAGAGGWVGHLIARAVTQWFGEFGASLLLFVIWMLSWSLILGLSWFSFFEMVGEMVEKMVACLLAAGRWLWGRELPKPAASLKNSTVPRSGKRHEPKFFIGNVRKERLLKKPQTAMAKPARESALPPDQEGGVPPLSLLDEPAAHDDTSDSVLRETSALIEKSLFNFNVSAKVVAVHPGPVITRYDLQPETGVRGAQVVNLTRDLARSLSVSAIRVLETIPGTNYIGLEIPNHNRSTVSLSEVLSSKDYKQSSAGLPLALGKTAAGNASVADLTAMPHLLVAGSTGSGKSVFINAILLSLLYSRSPQQLRLLLIDPKMLELAAYADIPHLMAPVVTDMTLAPAALHWAVEEMEERYRLMASASVRHIVSYNTAVAAGKVVDDENKPRPPMHYLVIVIDELADLMMVAGKKVELSINRLAQKARAAGIHLVLATQRPSVDVITGLIKANVPCRLSFQVASKVDSRTILDQMGAESLLGKGDMLYLPPGVGLPQRLHGAFVSDEEVKRVVDNIRQGAKIDYLTDFNDAVSVASGDASDEGEQDPLYDQAVEAVVEGKRASISLVQRKLRVGYNRAARLMESMEKAGLVSPMNEFGVRKVLVSGRGGGR